MIDQDWREIVHAIADSNRTRRPDGEELALQIRALRLHCGVTVPDVETGLARVREYYANGGTWMKPVDLRPKPTRRGPADQGLEGAFGGECPWPDCVCTHRWPCVKGWLDVDPDGFRPGEAARGAELRVLSSHMRLPEALAWAGGILKQEFGSPPPSGAKVTPCPECRPDQHEILTSSSNSRDQALGKLRHRKAKS